MLIKFIIVVGRGYAEPTDTRRKTHIRATDVVDIVSRQEFLMDRTAARVFSRDVFPLIGENSERPSHHPRYPKVDVSVLVQIGFGERGITAGEKIDVFVAVRQ